jgi:uncharacterized protein YwqG
MGWLDFLKTNKKQEAAQEPASSTDSMLDKVEIKPGITIARAFANEWPAFEASRVNCVEIKATPVQSMRLDQSKFGRYPKMPVDFEYPKGSDGNYLYPLAQINFKEVPPLAGYPASGFLQFYISVTDEAYGMDFTDERSQKDSRVLYFEEHEVEHPKTDFSFLHDIIRAEMSPVYKPHALTFSAKEQYFGMGDIRYETITGKIINGICSKYPEIEDELMESLYDAPGSNGHKIGGYAYFTQSDPREEDDDSIVLLQIDSDKEIMWGDVGVANFFIHPEDLAKKDFSKVLYNWDCC